jgi:hypothetical protein
MHAGRRTGMTKLTGAFRDFCERVVAYFYRNEYSALVLAT